MVAAEALAMATSVHDTVHISVAAGTHTPVVWSHVGLSDEADAGQLVGAPHRSSEEACSELSGWVRVGEG